MKRTIKITFSLLNILLIILLSMGLLLSCEANKRSSDFTTNMNQKEFFRKQTAHYLSQGEYDKAISSLNVLIKADPDFAIDYFNRGMACRNIGEIDQSIADLSKAIELSPNISQNPYLTRTNFFCNIDKIDECISYRNRAIELESENPTFYFLRGKTYLDLTDNIDQAISDFSRSIQLNPNSPAYVYYFRGQAYMMKQQFDNARSDYNKAIQLNPKLAYTRMDYTADSNKDKVNTPPDKKRTRPRVIRKVLPNFPYKALKKNITGYVIV